MSKEHFSDVPEHERLPSGIFGSDAGLAHFNSVPTARDKAGLHVRWTCLCGNPNRVTTEWSELIIIAKERIPQGWAYNDRGVAQPLVPCRGCGRPAGFGLTPDECRRAIEQGIAAHDITPQYVAQVASTIR